MDTANSKANSAFFALVFTSKFSQASVCRHCDPIQFRQGLLWASRASAVMTIGPEAALGRRLPWQAVS